MFSGVYNYVLGGMSSRVFVWGKCQGGECPGGVCPWGKCHRGTCLGGERYHGSSLLYGNISIH